MHLHALSCLTESKKVRQHQVYGKDTEQWKESNSPVGDVPWYNHLKTVKLAHNTTKHQPHY